MKTLKIKLIVFIFLVISIPFTWSQESTFTLNDTLFIERNLDSINYNAIYIEHHKNTEFYKWLTDFSFENDELQSLKNMHSEIKGKTDLIKTDLSKFNLEHEYLPLYQFQNAYYLYKPCDWGNIGQCIVTDSSIIYVFMDGPWPEFLKSVTQENDTYILKTCAFFNEKVNEAIVNITCIDPEKDIYLWETPDRGTEHKYQLFVSKEKAGNFPMIVNYSKRRKVIEFDFDKLDVEKLLKEKH